MVESLRVPDSLRGRRARWRYLRFVQWLRCFLCALRSLVRCMTTDNRMDESLHQSNSLSHPLVWVVSHQNYKPYRKPVRSTDVST